MLVLSVLAALGASTGWAAGIVLAQDPARALGAFEFTRIQLLVCATILAAMCAALGYWSTIVWLYWPAFAISICIGVVLGNLAMIECLRRGGPRRTELVLSLKGPIVAAVAFIWMGETPSVADVLGGAVVLSGVALAIQFGSNKESISDRITGRLGTVVMLGFAAAVFQGIGFLVMKPAMQAGVEPMAASAVRLAGASFVVSLAALWPIRGFRPRCELTPKLLGQTILPGFIGYGVSSTLLLYAFANLHAGIAAVLGSLSPILVLPIIWLKEGITPTPQAALGAVLAVFGTAIIVLL